MILYLSLTPHNSTSEWTVKSRCLWTFYFPEGCNPSNPADVLRLMLWIWQLDENKLAATFWLTWHILIYSWHLGNFLTIQTIHSAQLADVWNNKRLSEPLSSLKLSGTSWVTEGATFHSHDITPMSLKSCTMQFKWHFVWPANHLMWPAPPRERKTEERDVQPRPRKVKATLGNPLQ